MKQRWLFLLLPILIPILAVASPPPYKVETIGACTSADVSDEVKNSLQPRGFRILEDSGTFCEIWLRKVIPQKSAGTDYNTIADGTLAGVIIYSGKAGDYRGQKVAPGTYTMRYQTMPSDGNHMGVSPTTDYFLLAPAGADKNPEAVFDYENLINLSRKASKTNHPAPIYLVAPAAGGKIDFHNTESGQWVLELKARVQPGGGAEADLPLAIILIGKGEA